MNYELWDGRKLNSQIKNHEEQIKGQAMENKKYNKMRVFQFHYGFVGARTSVFFTYKNTGTYAGI